MFASNQEKYRFVYYIYFSIKHFLLIFSPRKLSFYKKLAENPWWIWGSNHLSSDIIFLFFSFLVFIFIWLDFCTWNFNLIRRNLVKRVCWSGSDLISTGSVSDISSSSSTLNWGWTSVERKVDSKQTTMAGTKLEIVSSQFQKNTNNEEKAILQNHWKLFMETIFHMDCSEGKEGKRNIWNLCFQTSANIALAIHCPCKQSMWSENREIEGKCQQLYRIT